MHWERNGIPLTQFPQYPCHSLRMCKVWQFGLPVGCCLGSVQCGKRWTLTEGQVPSCRVIYRIAEAGRWFEGIDILDMENLLYRFNDEDDGDEGGEVLLSEAGDVTDESAGVKGDQD